MKLEIDEKIIENIGMESFKKAIESSFNSFEVQNQISENCIAQILESNISVMLKNAMKNLSFKKITENIVTQLEKTVASMAQKLIAEAFVDVIFKLKHGTHYLSNEEETKEKEKIKQELSVCKH